MTLLEINGTVSFTIKRNDKNFQIDIQEDGIVINDFSGQSKVITTLQNENMDMIHQDKVHTLHFDFSGDES